MREDRTVAVSQHRADRRVPVRIGIGASLNGWHPCGTWGISRRWQWCIL